MSASQFLLIDYILIAQSSHYFLHISTSLFCVWARALVWPGRAELGIMNPAPGPSLLRSNRGAGLENELVIYDQHFLQC